MLIKLPITWLLLATVYFLFAKLGLLLAFEQVNTSPIWPPTGIALAACLYYGNKVAPGILLGAFIANIHALDGAALPSALIAIGNTFEAVIGSFLLARFSKSNVFHYTQGIALFTLAAMLACAISATNAMATLYLLSYVNADLLTKLWFTWWSGDLIGALVFAPLLITWMTPPSFNWSKSRIAELFFAALLLALGSYTIFSDWLHIPTHPYPLTFFVLPFMLWFSNRFHQHGSTLFIVFLAAISIFGTLLGEGPFVQDDTTASLLLLQSFIVILSLVTLTLTASNLQIKNAHTTTLALQEGIERQVFTRTQDFEQANAALFAELEEKEKTTLALEKLLSASTLKTDHGFYRSTVQNLAKTYQTDYAFIGIFTDQTHTAVRTLAVWARDDWADNFVYSLTGTPCQDVLNHDIECILSNASSLYPNDEMLIQMGIESYFGAPLLDSYEKMIGIVAIMSTQPMQQQSWAAPVFGLFANRIAAVIAQKPLEKELQLAASVFDNSVEAIFIADETGALLRANPAFTKITGYSLEEVLGRNSSYWKSGLHDQFFFQELWDSLLNKGFWEGEIVNRKKSGELYTSWQTITTVKDETDKPYQFINIFNDITERKKSDEKIFQLAHFDAITGLPNRTSLQTHLKTALQRAKRHNHKLAVLFLDVDNFKLINDSLGHAAGDQLLKKIAERLTAVIRTEDFVARLGGDEFTIVLSDTHANEDPGIVAEKILQCVSETIKIEKMEFTINVSIGISAYPDDGKTVSSLLKNADSAMYRAKANGKNNFQFFTEEMHQHAIHRLHLERAIRSAIINNEFTLHYQPQIAIESGAIVACEALIRWGQADGSYISPAEFIPVAEDSGLIIPIGEWVLKTALMQQQQWAEQGLPPIRVAVNISGRQLLGQDLYKIISEMIKKLNITPRYLELELTESILMENTENTIDTLLKLRELGVHLSIDDFGTGFSSMSYLKRLPINKLKIDQSFVQDLDENNDDSAIAIAIIAMSHSLNLSVIAEGVETQKQFEFLKKHQCDEVQGYYFSRPVTAVELAEQLTRQNQDKHH